MNSNDAMKIRSSDDMWRRLHHVSDPEVCHHAAMDETLAAKLFADAAASLADPKYPLADAVGKVPDAPGLYALYGSHEVWTELGLGQAPPGAALYVGKAEESLEKRELEAFRSGRTGQSGVRRSFAALLRDRLELRGLPRNPKKPERFDEFTLSEEDEAKLTAWMSTHLQLAAWAQPADCTHLGTIEIAVLKRWSPPLNLRDTRSTWGAKNSAALKAMATDARAWAREHGHKL
jgi:hypothetical protein